MRATIDKIIGGVLIVLMSIITLDVLWGVFTRYVLGSQASWSEELARFLLIWIGVLGAAYASGQGMHLAIDLMKKESKGRLSFLINFLIIAFAFCVMIIGGGRLIYITNVLEQLSPALRLPMSIVYAVIPLSGVLIIYYKISDLLSPA